MIGAVGNRARRRGALQPPARRPALRRALFGPLFPDQRRRAPTPSRRARCGTGGCGSTTPMSTSKPHLYDSTNSRRRTIPSRCASPSAMRSCPDRRSAGASRSRNRARRIDDQIRQAALDPDLELHRARRRACSSWPRCRPSTACGRCGACGAKSRRSGRAQKTRIGPEFPTEIRPLTEEINQLLAHSEAQAEEARRHAGNLAHALKTPLTVITNAATAHDARPCRHRVPRGAGDAPPGRSPSRPRPGDRPPRLGPRARDGVGEPRGGRSARSTGCTRMSRWTSPATTERRSGSSARTSTKCSATSSRMPRNTAAAGCSSRSSARPGFVDIVVEDDGPGNPGWRAARRSFDRGARLDTTGKPGTGLGLAIVRDVAEIYGGRDPPRGKRGPRRPAGAAEPARGLSGSELPAVPHADERVGTAPGSSAAAHCSHGASRSSKSFARSRSARAFPRQSGGVKIHEITSSWHSRAPVSWRLPRRRSRSGSRPSAPGAMTPPRWIGGQAGRRFLRLTSTAAGSSAPRSPPTAPSPASIRCSTTRSRRTSARSSRTRPRIRRGNGRLGQQIGDFYAKLDGRSGDRERSAPRR